MVNHKVRAMTKRSRFRIELPSLSKGSFSVGFFTFLLTGQMSPFNRFTVQSLTFCLSCLFGMSDTKHYQLANAMPVLCQITGYFTYGATNTSLMQVFSLVLPDEIWLKTVWLCTHCGWLNLQCFYLEGFYLEIRAIPTTTWLKVWTA